MIKVLFICHGNICRSPMARYIFEDLIRRKGCSDEFSVRSAATSAEELGNGLYPPAERTLNRHGIPCSGHIAQQIRREDYNDNDQLIGMDHANIRNMQRLFGGDPKGKIHLLSEYGSFEGEVADPWYTRDFELSYRQIEDGCRGLLKQLSGKQQL